MKHRTQGATEYVLEPKPQFKKAIKVIQKAGCQNFIKHGSRLTYLPLSLNI